MIEELEKIGISRDEIVQRIIDTAANALLGHGTGDEEYDEDEETVKSHYLKQIRQRLQDSIRVRIDRNVQRIADEQFMPILLERINTLALQRTSTWGEKQGAPQSFIEYLIACAEGYMLEPVDYRGVSQREAQLSRSSWEGGRDSSPRIQYAMDKYFKSYMAEAMKQTLASSTTTTAKAITDAVLSASKDALAKIRVEVKTS
jgi:hypothetical protein